MALAYAGMTVRQRCGRCTLTRERVGLPTWTMMFANTERDLRQHVRQRAPTLSGVPDMR
jgi:hypothetical protein